MYRCLLHKRTLYLMNRKPQNAIVQHLTMSSLSKFFGQERIHLLPGMCGIDQCVLDELSQNAGKVIEFHDYQSHTEQTLIEHRDMMRDHKKKRDDGFSCCGPAELMAYLSTQHGRDKTIHHQVVACDLFKIDNKQFYMAVGRISASMVLFLLSLKNSRQSRWPTSAIFLQYRIVG